MSLKQLDVDIPAAAVPPEAERMIRDAEAQIERFMHRRRDHPITAFVPSDFRLGYATLAYVRERRLSADMTFCEWGSGFGVTACLASQLGYDACGIEVEPDLIDASRQLAARHGLRTYFAQGSFIPESGDHLACESGEFATLATGIPGAYDELGLDARDFGVIYAYPWPGEEHVIEQIFEAYAATGALLITYRGMNQVQIHRQMGRKRRR